MKTITTAILVVSLLIAANCVKQENPTPRVSLHAAALQGSIDVIRQHIKAGSDLNEKDVYGSTPLIIAITFDKTEVARALIEAVKRDLKHLQQLGLIEITKTGVRARRENMLAFLPAVRQEE